MSISNLGPFTHILASWFCSLDHSISTQTPHV